jgi:hypothetical protein
MKFIMGAHSGIVVKAHATIWKVVGSRPDEVNKFQFT